MGFALVVLCGILGGAPSMLLMRGAGANRGARTRVLADVLTWFDGVFGRLKVLGRVRRSREAERRKVRSIDELPALLDALTLGLSAGLSFDASLELYCSWSAGELARAFEEAMLSWRMGMKTRREALWDLANELDVPALRRFASVVGEALAFGAPLARTLEGQARVIREEQRAQVEERIERVPVKMLIPLGTLVVPAMFLAVLGPLLGSVSGG